MFRPEKYPAPFVALAQSREEFSRSFLQSLLRTLPAATLAAAFATLATALPARAIAQEPNPMSQPAAVSDAAPNPITEQNGIYIYRVKVVQRSLECVNYLHRSGSTTIGFEGTPLLARAKGEAKVTSERGGITIDAKFQG